MLAAFGFLLAGCGSPSTAAGPSPTPVPPSRSAPSPSAGPDAASAPVIDAYLAATRAFVHAGSIPDANDPALTATMTGEERSTVKKNLIVDKAGDLIARGDITPMHPRVVSNDGSTAVLSDCQYSAALLYLLQQRQARVRR